MTKIKKIKQAEDEGQKAFQEWYARQPKGCCCRAILRVSGSDLFGSLAYSPERFNTNGCPHHS